MHGKVGFPFFGQLILDCLHRTEEAMSQRHTFLAIELALQAQAQALRIVDSPWIPGFLGISTLDYLTMPEVFLEANLAVEREFPDVIFLPGFWVEMGMGAEPSGFGCKVSLSITRRRPSSTR